MKRAETLGVRSIWDLGIILVAKQLFTCIKWKEGFRKYRFDSNYCFSNRDENTFETLGHWPDFSTFLGLFSSFLYIFLLRPITVNVLY